MNKKIVPLNVCGYKCPHFRFEVEAGPGGAVRYEVGDSDTKFLDKTCHAEPGVIRFIQTSNPNEFPSFCKLDWQQTSYLIHTETKGDYQMYIEWVIEKEVFLLTDVLDLNIESQDLHVIMKRIYKEIGGKK